MDTEKKTYEISFLAPTADGAAVVLKHLNQSGAEVVSEAPMEQINLAYEIKKHASAYLGCIHFALAGEGVGGLMDALRFEAGILRYTIVTPPFIKEADPQPRGFRGIQDPSPVERVPASDAVSSNKDLEAKLEEMSGSFEEEA